MREATPSPTHAARFRPSSRVKARSDFVRLQSGARRVHTQHFVVLLAVSPGVTSGAGPRLGITVTKKIGGAVERNRVKRLVREVFRQNPSYFPLEHDVVFVARAGAPSLDFEAVRAEVEAVRGAMRSVAERNFKAAREAVRC